MKISVCCRIYPSEDERLVRRSLCNLFADMEFVTIHDTICAHSDALDCLEGFREQIYRRHAAASLARQIRLNSDDGSFWFYLNKQAAAASVAALCESPDESAMGPIRVSVRTADMAYAAGWLAGGAHGRP